MGQLQAPRQGRLPEPRLEPEVSHCGSDGNLPSKEEEREGCRHLAEVPAPTHKPLGPSGPHNPGPAEQLTGNSLEHQR